MPKYLVLLLVFSLFFAACAPQVVPSTATPVPSTTFTPLPIDTVTAPSTVTPTSPPTATLPTSTTTLPPPTPTRTRTGTATRVLPPTSTLRPSITPVPTMPVPDFSKLGSGKIVFSSKHYNPAAEISIVDLKTNRVLRLIGNLFANNLDPRLSPDGTKVIFSSLINGSSEIFMLKVDEKTLDNFPENLEETQDAMGWLEKLGITQLTHTDYDEYDPTWSPDGNSFVYTALINNALDLYIQPLAGGPPLQITRNLYIFTPDFSPDGQKILFEDQAGGSSDIVWIPAGGGSRRKLTNSPGTSEHKPVWSPNGTKIAYCATYDYQSEILVMNADGSAVTRLTNHPASDCEPAWSPDGSQILFNSDRDGYNNLYVMDANGENVRQLTFFNRKNTAIRADWGK